MNVDWLFNPKVKPAEDLSEHDQRMIQLGWDAAQARQESVKADPQREKITDWIYDALKEIEKEEGIKLSDRGFIADHLAPKIIALFDDVKKQERITAKIICLCGSTRFTPEMLVKQWELTKQGYIVVSWCALPDNYFEGKDKTHIGDKEGVKEIVDELHKRKIDLCDEVFVLNIEGYIGESTTNEIAYAEKIGRPIRYWQALEEEGEL